MENECVILQYILNYDDFDLINIWLTNNCNCPNCNIYNKKYNYIKTQVKKPLYNDNHIMKVTINSKMKDNINKQINNKKIHTYVTNIKKNKPYIIKELIKNYIDKYQLNNE